MKETFGDGVDPELFADERRDWDGWQGNEPIVIGRYRRKFTDPLNRRVNWRNKYKADESLKVMNGAHVVNVAKNFLFFSYQEELRR